MIYFTRRTKHPERGFTTKRAERHANVIVRMSEASAGSKPVLGFTLIETLVAIAIFTLAIVAPFTVASRSLIAAADARDTLIASGLAQEGLEVVRGVRGSNYLANPSDWAPTTGLSTCISPASCRVDASTGTVAACSGACPVLYLSTTGLYNQSQNGTATRFTRSVSIKLNPSGQTDTERVTSTVTWKGSGATLHTVVLTEDFYDWL